MRTQRPRSRIRRYRRGRGTAPPLHRPRPSRPARQPCPRTSGRAILHRSRRPAPPGPRSAAVRRRARHGNSTKPRRSRRRASRKARSRSKSSPHRRRPSRPRRIGPPCPRASGLPSSASTRLLPRTTSRGRRRSKARAPRKRRKRSTPSRLTPGSNPRRPRTTSRATRR